MSISPARVAAYEILLRIERDSAYSSTLLPLYESDLIEKDAGLCHQLVLGVLRRKLYLDARIREHAGTKKIDVEVLTALRLGAYQLLELDRIPSHSAVNESVSLVQRAKKTSAKGFVNAVLRKIAGGARETQSGEALEDLSIQLSHPLWLLERWARLFGLERAISIAKANNLPSRIAYRPTNKGLIPDEPIGVPSEIVEGAFVIDRISRPLRDLAESGKIYFQDEASQLIAKAIQIPRGGRFLDVCAAPGGKTSLVGVRNPDSTIVAGDVYLARVEFLRANCIRQGITNICAAQYDAATSLPFQSHSFDTVFIDAPCSGTGTIGSNPEIRYSLRPEDIDTLSRKQLAILVNASKLVTSGGRLYYATCSLEREENEGVVEAFLSEVKDFTVAPTKIAPRFETTDGFGRTFPDRDGTDGFFFAAFLRG